MAHDPTDPEIEPEPEIEAPEFTISLEALGMIFDPETVITEPIAPGTDPFDEWIRGPEPDPSAPKIEVEIEFVHEGRKFRTVRGYLKSIGPAEGES